MSSTRISEYQALASPSLIALSSPDPLMTAFQLSWELRQLAQAEPESREEYVALRQQVERSDDTFTLFIYFICYIHILRLVSKELIQ